jgi:hypothetical protein
MVQILEYESFQRITRPSRSGGRKAHMKEEPRELPPVSLHGVVLPPDSENQSGRK